MVSQSLPRSKASASDATPWLQRQRNRLMNLPRDSRDTLFLLVVIAFVLAPQLAYLPVWCSVTAGVVLAWRGIIAWRNGRLPHRVWLMVMLIVAVGGTFASHKTIVGREAGVTLLALLLVLKTMELRARRDAYVVFFLSFFAILTAFFNSQSLGTAALVFLAFFGLLTALINANMPAGRPPLRLVATIAAKLMAVGAPVMLALFLLFPRFAPLWGMPAEQLTGKTGLSDRMEVGSMASLVLDEGIAFRIKFDDQPPRANDMYFRGPVLANFDGRRWQAEISDDGFAALASDAPSDITPRGDAVRYEVTMEPNRRTWLFVLEAASQAPQLPPPYRTRLSSQLQWITNRPVDSILRYRAESNTQYTYATALKESQLRKYLYLPAGFDPRTRELGQRMREANPQASARALAEQALQRLRTGYTYTLDPGIYPRDTADYFWFELKEGFCEHIASAFVVLMRAAGVPSRIVTGYQGGEVNGVDGYWAVRQADAHAWAEIWQAGEGWLRVDPTGAVMPARVGAFSRLRNTSGVSGVLANLSPGLLQQMRHVWDAINNAWTQRVLNYTQGEQLNLLKKLGFGAPDWRDLLRLLAGLVTLFALVMAGSAAIKRRHRDPWIRLLQTASDRWQDVGIHTTQPTPRRLASAINTAADVPEHARKAWSDWLLALERQRYATAARDGAHNGTLKPLRHALSQLPAPSQWRKRISKPSTPTA